ncbi:tetratricopeptide repeat protein [Kordiimonas aestuarii]|uniref:tetratricopeptide repeat protein n=1 Tax=Kordiimonas aestuarii TaxID=1005925 RepID=UPI0021CEDB7E|nr:tetratricopeptide repeat protein [Kordiimonas aestuarii]
MRLLNRPVIALACVLGTAFSVSADRFSSDAMPKLEIILRASENLKRGNELIIRGDAIAAREVYARALRGTLTMQQRARAHNGLCVSYIMEEEWVDALKQCNTAISIAPNNWRFYNNRGNIFLETGEIGRAQEEYARGLELAPSSVVIQRNIELAEGRAQGLKAERPQNTRPI